MKICNSFFLKLKHNFFSLLLLLFTICILLFSTQNIESAKSGLALWVTSIVPSLFPFFIAAELLSHSSIPRILSKLFTPVLKPVFNISGVGIFAFFMGLISGYPVSAKIIVNFRENNMCSKEECERLLSFTNNSSPLFIIGSVGISLFKSSTIGILLYFSHLLASFTVGYIFRFWKSSKEKLLSSYNSFSNDKMQTVNILNFGEILGKSISSAISTIFMVGGFVVFFSVIISILNTSGITNIITYIFNPICSNLNIPNSVSYAVFNGLLENTNGIFLISNIKLKQLSINLILTSFLLGFGGICVFLQIFDIVKKSDLSIKPYIIGKILQGCFSVFYTFFLIQICPFFRFDL